MFEVRQTALVTAMSAIALSDSGTRSKWLSYTIAHNTRGKFVPTALMFAHYAGLCTSDSCLVHRKPQYMHTVADAWGG